MCAAVWTTSTTADHMHRRTESTVTAERTDRRTRGDMQGRSTREYSIFINMGEH